MNRRDALTHVSIILGGTLIGAEAFLSGCKPAVQLSNVEFTPANLALLDEVAETILPTTASSPGAKEAKVAEFMRVMVTDCYAADDQKVFLEGVPALDEKAKSAMGSGFMQLDAAKRTEFLTQLDAEAKEYEKNKKEGEKSHYFTMVKQLTLFGYFTSEAGATKALRYVEVPGRYEGCVPYTKGEKAWAI